MGTLIVLEGIDGSGKSTQFELLCRRLQSEGRSFKRLVFPRYDSESSALIRMYLGGQFGADPSSVNAYAASTFFSVDRYASYVTEWKDYYLNGGLLLSDRYTTSNAIHQGSKLQGEDRKDFLNWLYQFEFDLLGLPRPDAVIYLDVPSQVSVEHIKRRSLETGAKADIHEQSAGYLEESRRCGLEAAGHYGWKVVDCAPDGVMRSIEDIGNEIYKYVEGVLL